MIGLRHKVFPTAKTCILSLFLAVTGCSTGEQESAEANQAKREHLEQLNLLAEKRESTQTAIKGMDIPELFKTMEADAQQGREPFNSPAFREITTSRREAGEALIQAIRAQRGASYISFLALRKIDSKGYASIAENYKLNALLGELGRSTSYNKWGLPHLYWEDAAKAIIEMGEAAVPGLKNFLKDTTPAPVWGSEEVAEYEAYGYRRCDYALALLMAIFGQDTKTLPKQPEARDALIDRIQRD